MKVSLPDPNTTAGKMFLSVFDKAVLGVALAIAGFFVSEYWRASTVGARIVEQIPAKLNEATGELARKIPEIAVVEKSERSLLVKGAIRQIEEIKFWISLGDGLSSTTCRADYLNTLTYARNELPNLNIAKSEELRRAIVESFPSVVECIKDYQRSSLDITNLF